MAAKKKSVMVGMSGGVDSTVTALLLKEQGYNVVGVTFRLWSPEDEWELPPTACCSVDDVRDAKMVCETLDIPHYVFNYKDLFRRTVVNNFVEAYIGGKTPNPCIDCNKHIKFDSFLTKAKGLGYDYVATGHYSIVEYDESRGHYRFKRGASPTKDQSYFLYNLTRKQLECTLMPLGKMDKPEVREIARRAGFAASTKPDSQDICFVPDGDYATFLKGYTGKDSPAGDFVATSGEIIGRHLGIWNYTIGQRKGLGTSFGRPMFVKEILPRSNQIVLGSNEELFADQLVASDLNWIDIDDLIQPIEATAKIRSTAQPVACTILPSEQGSCRVVFKSPQRAITAGQAVVFYDGDYVIGGGTIIG